MNRSKISQGCQKVSTQYPHPKDDSTKGKFRAWFALGPFIVSRERASLGVVADRIYEVFSKGEQPGATDLIELAVWTS